MRGVLTVIRRVFCLLCCLLGFGIMRENQPSKCRTFWSAVIAMSVACLSQMCGKSDA